jgi:hypothetical protein
MHLPKAKSIAIGRPGHHALVITRETLGSLLRGSSVRTIEIVAEKL